MTREIKATANSEKPLISFILPVLNEEQELPWTIAQIKTLNIVPKEIIVADGGSTDQTVTIAKALADKVYERNGQRNKSIAENRNKGAALAVGQYLFFIDCGVKVEKLNELVWEIIRIFSKQPAIVGITLKIRFFSGEEKIMDKFFLAIINNFIILLNKLRIGLAMGWVQVIRKDVFWQIGGYNENLITTEDSDLFRRLNKVGRTVCLKNFVVAGSAWRYHQDGWLKVTIRWFLNFLWYIFNKSSYTKQWQDRPTI